MSASRRQYTHNHVWSLNQYLPVYMNYFLFIKCVAAQAVLESAN